MTTAPQGHLVLEPVDVYVFCSGSFALNCDSVVCVGPRKHIEALLGPASVETLFFGYALYRDDNANDFIGVWGRRNASRLRRLLREQGATLVVHKEPPPARLVRWGTTGIRQPAARR